MKKASTKPGVVAAILGAIISLGPTVAAMPESTWTIILGAVIAVAGVVQVTLARLGIIKPREKK